jgi:hypothetical protein
MRSGHLPERFGSVTFEAFEAAFLKRQHQPRWDAVFNRLRADTPQDRWPADSKLDTRALRYIIVNAAWCAATARKRASGPHAPSEALRTAARVAREKLDEAAAAYAALGEAYAGQSWTLAPGDADRRVLAASLETAPVDRGGRPRNQQFEILLTLLARFHSTLTGRPFSGSMRDPFAVFALSVINLAIQVRGDSGFTLLDLPAGKDAIRKGFVRFATGQNQRQNPT